MCGIVGFTGSLQAAPILLEGLKKLDYADDCYQEYVKCIQSLPRFIQQAIDMNPSVPALAKKYHKSKALFFIGRNTDYATSLEGALKMKEISYLHSEAYAAVEIVPLQFLAYHVAKENGCDIDKPKNLAKSVTVE
ncbi:MAG: SIS domain-containing protein [Clostridia bacterium]|nr:SIS domain-containing protein [Clostridia bacterium]